MNSFSEVIKKFREIFDIAADVKDTEINKCIQEADKLDIKVALCGDTFFSVSSELGGGKGESDIPAGTDSDSNYSLDVVIAGLLCVCAIYEDSGPKKHIYRTENAGIQRVVDIARL